jgi:hypothetical protein
VPAGGASPPPFSDGFGHHPAGTTIGARGASLDWDWDWDWDRPGRVTPVQPRKVSAPRLGRPYRIERSGRVPGSLA